MNPYRPVSSEDSNSERKKTMITKNRLLASALILVGYLCFQGDATAASDICPGSPASVHAKCQMDVRFPETGCAQVVEEMTLRLEHNNGWVDPHNHGTYKLLSSEASTDEEKGHVVLLKASRTTGGGKYTDLLNLQITQVDGDCLVQSCSESQVTSILDFSTNFCNIHNLYCSGDCKPIKHNLGTYHEDYNNCGQRSVAKCTPGE